MSNNIKTDFTWATIMPLIGGMPLGTEKAFGKPPEAIYSYAGIPNDEHYVNYQHNTLGRKNIPFVTIDPNDNSFIKKVNLVVCTPLCSGLSSLNTSKNVNKQGTLAEANQTLYNTLTNAAKKFDPEVIILENAPALATNKGKGVADKLYELGKELGYSLVLYKTSTHFHGTPQRRDRTFACFFKGTSSPILEYSKIAFMPFQDYLKTMQLNAVNDDTIINSKLISQDVYYKFLKYKFEDVRKVLIENNKITCLNYVRKNGYAEEITEWVKQNGNDKDKKKIAHANNKFSQGLGVWDDSVHVFGQYTNAIIGRNMADSIHPTEDRSLTYLEALYMMGFPEDFELIGGKKNVNHIAQNVTVTSAEFISSQALKYLNGELTESSYDYLKIDNWNDKLEPRSEEKVGLSLDEHFSN